MSVTGSRCEASADSPIAAATEVSASSTGTAAASSAPKVTIRMTSVTGRLSSSACSKSSSYVSVSAFSMVAPPTCSTRRSGYADCTAAVASTSGCTLPSAVSASPVISTRTSTAPPFGAGTGGETVATSGSRSSRRPTSAAAAAARSRSSAPDRLVTRTFSVAGSSNAPLSTIRSDRPHSPTAASASDWERVPTAPPTPTQTATNAIHASTARQRCSALHRATRTTRLGRLLCWLTARLPLLDRLVAVENPGRRPSVSVAPAPVLQVGVSPPRPGRVAGWEVAERVPTVVPRRPASRPR